MNYQIFAHKWRPNDFTQFIGQEHVVMPLQHALQRQQLHHAYLFTGTRGVGKTSIARVFAKALNCEVGITDKPCNVCAHCREITEGSFIDLLEIDAASKTKVEDTRTLLDNVQYMPTQGRFKIYLIDEVHMLSNHSFNALLKTLEEPPAYVKFLLATTEPEKLLKTILSRCLKFHLKHITPEKISQRLVEVLQQEKIDYELNAVEKIAYMSTGSMRDALTLLEQVVAYSDKGVQLNHVDNALGLVPQRYITALLRGLLMQCAQRVLAECQQLKQFAVDYQLILTALLENIQQMVAFKLMLGDKHTEEHTAPLEGELVTLAKDSSLDLLQTIYQVLLLGKEEIAIVLDKNAGFFMVLLRSIASPAPASSQSLGKNTNKASEGSIQKKVTIAGGIEKQVTNSIEQHQEIRDKAQNVTRPSSLLEDKWEAIIPKLDINGMTLLLAKNCIMDKIEGSVYYFKLENAQRTLLTSEQKNYLQHALSHYLQEKIRIEFDIIQKLDTSSPFQQESLRQDAEKKKVLEGLAQDKQVQALKQTLSIDYSEKDVIMLE